MGDTLSFVLLIMLCIIHTVGVQSFNAIGSQTSELVIMTDTATISILKVQNALEVQLRCKYIDYVSVL